MDVYSNEGKPLGIGQLVQQLKNCVSQGASAGPPVGILTTMERSAWAEVYSDMITGEKFGCQVVSKSVNSVVRELIM